MRQRLADFDVEVSIAEREKFAAPLVLLHGLWLGPSIWRNFAGYLSHRGWTSYVPALRSHPQAVGWSNLLSGLQQLLEHLDAAPVIIGHDLGALLALHLPPARAVAGLSPLVPGRAIHNHPIFSSWRGRLAHWLGRPVRPTAREAARTLGIPSPGDALAAEASQWLDDLAALDSPGHDESSPPRLLGTGTADGCVDVAEVELLAATSHAELLLYPDRTHALPFGPGWETVVSDVHRWIVRKLGSSVLLLTGDEDLREE